jgi:hypothetical protein
MPAAIFSRIVRGFSIPLGSKIAEVSIRRGRRKGGGFARRDKKIPLVALP